MLGTGTQLNVIRAGGGEGILGGVRKGHLGCLAFHPHTLTLATGPADGNVAVHSLRKTAGMSALRHGAQVQQVQAWMGHAEIRTTQEYIVYRDQDAEEAARHCQIR